jgi:hypothetical protein
MPKAEISWTRRDDEGQRWQVYAQRFGGRWLFYARRRRFDEWQSQPNPPLEDWMELLDAVRRRVPRRRLPPVEVERVKQAIRERFPEASLDP